MAVINAVTVYKQQDSKVNTIILPCLRFGQGWGNNERGFQLSRHPMR